MTMTTTSRRMIGRATLAAGSPPVGMPSEIAYDAVLTDIAEPTRHMPVFGIIPHREVGNVLLNAATSPEAVMEYIRAGTAELYRVYGESIAWGDCEEPG